MAYRVCSQRLREYSHQNMESRWFLRDHVCRWVNIEPCSKAGLCRPLTEAKTRSLENPWGRFGGSLGRSPGEERLPSVDLINENFSDHPWPLARFRRVLRRVWCQGTAHLRERLHVQLRHRGRTHRVHNRVEHGAWVPDRNQRLCLRPQRLLGRPRGRRRLRGDSR